MFGFVCRLLGGEDAESECSPACKDSEIRPETEYVPSFKLSGPSLSVTSAS